MYPNGSPASIKVKLSRPPDKTGLMDFVCSVRKKSVKKISDCICCQKVCILAKLLVLRAKRCFHLDHAEASCGVRFDKVHVRTLSK